MAILLSVGTKGYGKSTLLRRLISACLAEPAPGAHPPLIWCHDPQGGLEVPSSQVFTSVAHWRARREVPALSVFRAIGDLNELAALACEVGDVTLVLDEIDRACADKKWLTSKHLATDDCRDGAWVKRIVHETRHYRVNLWGGCRRFANIPEDLVTQADVVFLFHHDQKAVHDLRAIEARFGADVREAAQRLDVGQFITLGGL